MKLLQQMTWEGWACHEQFFLLFSLLTFHNFTSNASGQPFLFTSHSPHPLPLERCKVNISIGLQWPVSAALIPTLLFEGSIVPDLLAWFACLWIMAKEPRSGLLPSTHFSLSWVWSSKHIWITVIYPYGMESLILGYMLRRPRRAVCPDTVTPPTVHYWLRHSIPVWTYTKHMGVNSPDAPHTGARAEGRRCLRSSVYNFVAPRGPSSHQSNPDAINWRRGDLKCETVSSLSRRSFEFRVSVTFESETEWYSCYLNAPQT